jgi:cell fate regulator YaaT (PSP1 superfamily)
LINTDAYVILEADRGEDCGRIIGTATKEDFENLVRKYENIINEVNPKKIYRLATDTDFKTLKRKKELEKAALEFCAIKCKEKSLHMKVVDCEYQWDLNKITFYFDSDDRIDFRELVKELYKIYKTRIWMCSIEKSKNKHLRELVLNKF